MELAKGYKPTPVAPIPGVIKRLSKDIQIARELFRRRLGRSERMAETREVMDVREASHYLGVSRETLYKYVYEDRIPAFKLGNRWKFKKTVLDRWMERQSTRHEERAERKGRAVIR